MLVAFPGYAAQYYVSTAGNDSNVGDFANPWLTPQKAADTLVAGDIVDFLGGTYPGMTITTSGTSTDRITYRAYQGQEVILLRRPTAGADAVIIPAGTTWTNISGTRWSSPIGMITNNGVGGLMRNHNVWFARTQSPSNYFTHGGNPWYYFDAANDRVFIDNPNNPTLDEWVVVDNGNRSIYVNGADYLTFDGLTVQYGYDGMFTNNSADHIIYRNMVARYNGRRGLSVSAATATHTTDHLFEDNEWHTNGEHGMKLTDDVTPEGAAPTATNYVFNRIRTYNNGYHGIQLSNGGDTLTVNHIEAFDNGINPCGWNNNTQEGCASFASNLSNGLSDNVTWSDVESYSSGTRPYYATDRPSLVRPGFSMFSNEGVTLQRAYIHDNNGPGFYGTQSTLEGSGNVVKNSVIVNNGTYDVHLIAIDHIPFSNNTIGGGGDGTISVCANCKTNDFQNNAIFTTSGAPLITVASASTTTFDHNAYYSPDATPFTYYGTAYNFADYKAASGQDAASYNYDFTAEFTNFAAEDFSLTAGSLLKDLGTTISGVTTDFINTARPQGPAFSIGAYEGIAVSEPTTTGTTFMGVGMFGITIN